MSHKLNARCSKTVIMTILLCLCIPLPLFFSSHPAVYAEGEPTVSLSISETTVHSGAQVALTATLSSPAQKKLAVALTGGAKDCAISIPQGETSGTLTVKAGQYKERSTETYSIVSGSDYAVGNNSKAQITVLPKPRLVFYAEQYTASPGSKLTVNMKCLNASEMTIPIKVTVESYGEGAESRTIVSANLPLSQKASIETGMEVRIGNEKGKVLLISVIAESENLYVLFEMEHEIIPLPEGEHDAVLVLESTTPISFLWNK